MSSLYEVGTLGIFLKKVAYDCARYGYTEYALREIPEGKDREAVARELVKHYRITRCRTTRAGRKKEGKANVTLVMYRKWFVLLATKGAHETFSRIVRRDLHSSPLHFMGYSVGMKGEMPWVMVAPKRWKRIEDIGREIALHNEEKVRDFFHRFLEKVSGYRFPGVVAQKKKLLAEVNERRRRARLPRIRVPETWRGRQ